MVSLRTKNTSDKSLAVSSGVTALMGIIEPVLYGVNQPKKYPLIAAMIGGGPCSLIQEEHMPFRSDFLWGGDTTANQFEGGWNEVPDGGSRGG